MKANLLLLLVVECLIIVSVHCDDYDEDGNYVTCGSVIKLVNHRNHVRLHSHDVKYGSGSGQQSVTGVSNTDDNNSYWQVKGKQGVDCERGKPIKCGQTLRLMHLSTRKNLHSHHFQSPLSSNYEVSCFGEDAVGDSGDDWMLVCNEKFWERDEKIRLKHIATDGYLHITGDSFGRPIHGQMEVCAYRSMNDLNLWSVAEGVYIQPKESVPTSSHDSAHEEL